MSGKVPFTLEQVEADLRSIIDAMGGILATLFYFPDEMRDQFLGIEIGDREWWAGAYSDGPGDDLVSRIPLDRHPMVDVVRKAYAYAYQLDGAPSDESDVEMLWYDVAPVSDHLPVTYINGLPTQMNYVNGLSNEKDTGIGRIRRVLDTFTARYELNTGHSMTVDELALLADMATGTVRTSLSKEGFRLYVPEPLASGEFTIGRKNLPEIGRNVLSNEDAKAWLSKRRGFIPNRQPGTGIDWKIVARNAFSEEVTNFPVVLKRICNLAGMDAFDLGTATAKNPVWIEGLLNGEKVEIDMDALVRLARLLHIEPAKFASHAVAHLLDGVH